MTSRSLALLLIRKDIIPRLDQDHYLGYKNQQSQSTDNKLHNKILTIDNKHQIVNLDIDQT